MLNVSRNWFYKMRKAGKFVKPAIERPMRWRLDQINNFLDGSDWKITYKKFNGSVAILDPERLEILGDEYSTEILKANKDLYIKRAKKSQKICQAALNTDKRRQGTYFPSNV